MRVSSKPASFSSIFITKWVETVTRKGDILLMSPIFFLFLLLVSGFNLTTNQYHWNINNLIDQVGKYQVGGFPFTWTFLNLRTTFQFSSLVKHQLDWYKSVSIYWISVYPLYKEINSLIQYLEWGTLKANLFKTITSPAPVLTGYWTLVSQDTIPVSYTHLTLPTIYSV